jgi:hypothetical protein
MLLLIPAEILLVGSSDSSMVKVSCSRCVELNCVESG